ncbi:MAG: competence/damage-inducible protein A [Melioribacteraceae bacterium]|nr:competence/damage-inducible protein A [Melioribacteraceae bacterium]
MKAILISVGDELLIGQTVNTNASFISEKLTENGIIVVKHIVVGDNEDIMLKSFDEAIKKSDLVVVTGGLGPTHDDVTRKAVVKFFNTELILNSDVLADIQDMFSRRGREVTSTNKDQAFVPKNATVIRNSRGTAPGIWIEENKKIFVVMPGVPYEMKEMMESTVLPNLREKLSTKSKTTVTTNLLTTGIPESILYERLGNLDELLEGASLAFLPNQFGVKLRLTIKSKSLEEASDKLLHIEQKIRGIVGRFIYGKDTDTLESVVGKLLNDRGLRIAVAESCTGGLISARLTNISGSSSYFERAFITYSNGAKVEHLNIDEDLIQKYGAVSLEVARLMADGVKAVSGTDIGLSATGIMGPTGATPDKPVGLVFIGICDEKICTAREFKFGDDRILNKDRTSQAALEMLRRNLLGIPYEE